MPSRLRTSARSAAVFLGVSTVLVGPAVSPAQATPYDVGTYQLVNMNSNQCLEVADWSTAWGAAVRQWPCTGGANQKWVQMADTDPNLGEVRYYRNVNSGACIDVAQWNTNNGAAIDQWQCTYQLNQQWYNQQVNYLQTDTNFVYNKCLEIADWSLNAGAPAQLWDCTGGANQKWKFVAS